MEEQIIQLRERVAVNEQSTKSAHARIDQMDRLMRDDLKTLKEEVKGDIKSVADDMKIVLAVLERSKGMIAVITVISGFLGWIIQLVINSVFHK